MKLEYRKGNLLDVTEGHIVHGVNAQGVMNSGVAKHVREKYPQVYKSYSEEHKRKNLKLGNVFPIQMSDKLYVWNSVTQEFYGRDGSRYVSYDAIETCFYVINEFIKTENLNIAQVLNIPMIGSGLGGGKWNIIKTIIEETVTIPTIVWSL